METFKAGADFCNHKVVNAIKSARIDQYLASAGVRWQEDKYALQQQQQKASLKQVISETYAFFFLGSNKSVCLFVTNRAGMKKKAGNL